MNHFQPSENMDVLQELHVDHSDEWSDEDFEDATSFSMTYCCARLDDD